MNFSEKRINAAKSGDTRLYSKTHLFLSQNLSLNDKRYEKADWETIDSIFEHAHGNYGEAKIENNERSRKF